MKINCCELIVPGYYDLHPEHCKEDRPKSHWVRSSDRLNRTTKRPILEMIRMKGSMMRAVQTHLLEDRCPCCQPGRVMRMFADRASKIGYCNTEVLRVANRVQRERPMKATGAALKRLEALRAQNRVQQDHCEVQYTKAFHYSHYDSRGGDFLILAKSRELTEAALVCAFHGMPLEEYDPEKFESWELDFEEQFQGEVHVAFDEAPAPQPSGWTTELLETYDGEYRVFEDDALRRRWAGAKEEDPQRWRICKHRRGVGKDLTDELGEDAYGLSLIDARAVK